jgi:hypothetical protein
MFHGFSFVAGLVAAGRKGSFDTAPDSPRQLQT